MRVFRLSRIRGKVAYATKAEHDFKRPADFDPREYAARAEWQFGDEVGWPRSDLRAHRLADRAPLRALREVRPPDGESGAQSGDRVFHTAYANPRTLVSWVLGLGEHARILGPAELLEEYDRRVELIGERHAATPILAGRRPPAAEAEPRMRTRSRGRATVEDGSRSDAAIRPERFARLVTLASILIEAGRAGRRLKLDELCERLQISDLELREDINVLNVVNFGGGSYVLYAEIFEDTGEIEVDPEPYSDNFARPARLLPVEAKALVAAIDLIGEHIPEGSLASAREKIVKALGEDPLEQGLHVAHTSADDSEVARLVSTAITQHRLVELDYYKENEDEFSKRDASSPMR